MGIKIIGFDFDDTMTDTVDYVYEMFKFWWDSIKHKGNYTGTYIRTEYYIENRFTGITELEKRQFMSWYWSTVSKNAPVRRGLAETVKELHEYGYDVHIVTRRSTVFDKSMNLTGPMVRIETENWLRGNNVMVDKIHYNCTNKLQTMKEHGIDVLVDDEGRNITMVAKERPVIIVDSPWNQQIDLSNTYRIKDFDPEVILGVLTKFDEYYGGKE